MNVKDELIKYKSVVDIEIKNFFESKSKDNLSSSLLASIVLQNITNFTLRGGKRIRAAFVYYTYKLLGGMNDEEIIKLSVFIELFQSYLLIHDDIADNADLRRNNTTIHKIYEQYALNSRISDIKHFGIVMGMWSGDITSNLAFECISETNFPTEDKLKLINYVAKRINAVNYGQFDDFILPIMSTFTQEDIINIMIQKTSTYTYEIPMLAGAFMAGASETDIDIIKCFALNAGITFQIRDDILGMFGDEKKLGKPADSDIKEGKKTLLILKALEKASQQDRDFIYASLGNQSISDEELNRVRDIIRSTGSLEYSENLCREYVKKAQEKFNLITKKNDHAWQFINDITEYMIVRDR